ncbi:MAG: cytochrome c oxidase subunit II [Gammaproteobacteria bacterium]
MLGRKILGIFLSTLSILLSTAAFANNWGVNMPVGVTPLSASIHSLHMTMFWVCVGIGVVVFGVMTYSIIHHRKSKGHQAANFHENTHVEIIWTVIPFIILIAMAIPATKTLLEMDNTEAADLTIKVTGYRWYWHYDYLDEELSFFSHPTTTQEEIQNLVAKREHYNLAVDQHLVLPINKKIRFAFTSNDVIHSWWVHELGVKKDSVPGFITESWAVITEPGIYRGQCAELCGAGHAYMPIVVEAKTQEDYDAWLSEMKANNKNPS